MECSTLWHFPKEGAKYKGDLAVESKAFFSHNLDYKILEL